MVLLAILLSAAVPVAAAPRTIGPVCKNPGKIMAGKANGGMGAGMGAGMSVRPLGDEPPAQHILAVLRTDVDGCVTPVVVNAKVGRR